MIAIERKGFRIRIRRVPRTLRWLDHAMRRELRQAERNLELHAARAEAARRGWATRKAQARGNSNADTRAQSTGTGQEGGQA